MADRHLHRENLLQQLVEAERHVAQGEEHISTQALHRQNVERILRELAH